MTCSPLKVKVTESPLEQGTFMSQLESKVKLAGRMYVILAAALEIFRGKVFVQSNCDKETQRPRSETKLVYIKKNMDECHK